MNIACVSRSTGARRIRMMLMACLMCFSAWSQVSDLLPTSVMAGNAGVACTDVWTAFANPATLVQEHRLQFACQYENRYIISQLSTEMIQAAWHNSVVNVGVAYMHFGYKHYGEQLVGVVAARDFGHRFSLGMQIDYYMSYMGPELGYQGTLLPQVGLTVDLGRGWTMGFHVFNPFLQRLRGELVDKPLPARYSLGTCWQLSRDVRWLFQADKWVDDGLRAGTGVEWQAVDLLRLRVGASWEQYFVGTLGAGLTFGPLGVDVSAEVHPILGVCLTGRLSYVL